MGNAQNLDVEGNSFYFSVGAKVFKENINTTVIADTPLFVAPSTSAYIGYGFGVDENRVYITEAAADFTSFGKVFIYSSNGTYLDEFQTGLGPNGVYFN